MFKLCAVFPQYEWSGNYHFPLQTHSSRPAQYWVPQSMLPAAHTHLHTTRMHTRTYTRTHTHTHAHTHTHLSRCLHSSEETDVHQQPGTSQSQKHLPVEDPRLRNAVTYLQCSIVQVEPTPRQASSNAHTKLIVLEL